MDESLAASTPPNGASDKQMKNEHFPAVNPNNKDPSSPNNVNQNNEPLSEESRSCGESDRIGTSQESNIGMEVDSITESPIDGGESSGLSSQAERDVLPLDDSVVEKLTDGFLQAFRPHAESSNAVLDELMRNQRVLIETLEQENAKFQENKIVSELAELMTEAKRYHSKLVHLRKEMISLHDKSTKLKKRALKLQHHKMKQNLQKEQQREREMEQEKHLIAKPATKKTP